MSGLPAALEGFRAQFPITRSRAYLFTGAIAPGALPVRAALDRWIDRWMSDPLQHFDHIESESEQLRIRFAALIGADPSDVAIVDNTSRGSNIAVRLLADRKGTNVVVDDTTYPSSLYPWLLRPEKQIRRAVAGAGQTASEAIADQVDDGTIAVTVSHVSPRTGRCHDLVAVAEVVHAQGGLLIVDAAQSTGVVPIDVTRDGIDILVSTSMKWLLGLPGVGFIYVRRDVLEEGLPLDIGYRGLAAQEAGRPATAAPRLLPGAVSLELGVPALSVLAAAGVGIEMILDLGVDVISARVSGLVSYCVDALVARGVTVRTPSDPPQRAGVIVFEHAAAPAFVDFARQRGVDIGGYPWGVVRVDPHAFNTVEDIDLFLEALDAF